MQTVINTQRNVQFHQKLPLVLTGKLLPILSLLVITILFSRNLGYEEYGKFQAVWVLSSLSGTLLSFGLPAIILATPPGMLRQYLRQHRLTIATGYFILFIIGIVVIWYGTTDFSLYLKAMVAVFILFQTACIIAETRLIKKNILTSFVIINTGYSILFFSVHVFLLYHSFSLEKLVTSIVVLNFLKLALLLFIKKQPGVKEDHFTQTSFISNWFYTGLNEVTGIVTRWLDKIFVLYLLSAADFAVFYNGAFEIPLFAVLISAMENVMLSNISGDLSNKAEAKNIFRESFKVLSLVAFPVFFFFMFTHEEAYSFIFNDKYNASIPVFLISIFIIPLRITHYGVILQCYGKAHKLVLGSIMDILISLGLMFALYPSMGTRGVVLALVISTYLQVSYYLFHSAKTLGMKITDLVPVAYLLKLFILLGCGYFLLGFTRNYMSPLFYLGSMFIISACTVMAGLYWYFFVRPKNTRLLNQPL